MNPLSLLPPPPSSTNFFNDPHNHHYRGNPASSCERRRTRPRLHDPRAPPPPVPASLSSTSKYSSLFFPHAQPAPNAPSSRREHATRRVSPLLPPLLFFFRFLFPLFFSFPSFLDLSSNFPPFSQPPRERCCRASKSDKPRHYRVDRHFRHAEDGTSPRVPTASVINRLLPLFVNTFSSFSSSWHVSLRMLWSLRTRLLSSKFQLDVSSDNEIFPPLPWKEWRAWMRIILTFSASLIACWRGNGECTSSPRVYFDLANLVARLYFLFLSLPLFFPFPQPLNEVTTLWPRRSRTPLDRIYS